MTARSAVGAALAVSLVGGVAFLWHQPDPGIAAPSCQHSPPRAEVSLGPGERAVLSVGAGGRVRVNGQPCETATTGNTEVVEVRGARGAQKLVVDLRGGFDDLKVDAHLREGDRDAVGVVGRRAGDAIDVASPRIAIGDAGGPRIVLGGIERVILDSGGGNDSLDARSFERRLAATTGRGRDRIHGGRRGDRLEGGPGPDVCWGGRGTDRLVSCAPPFDPSVSRIERKLRRRMTGNSWHRGCPVSIGKLRLLRLRHWTMGDRDVHAGKLVVHRDAAADVVRAMRSIYEHRFPIRRMELVDAYGSDDQRMMRADLTSAFNCRFVAGTSRWSQHAYGRAIDLNPIENPYVTPSGHVSPAQGRPYANRSRRAAGMVHRGDAVVDAFDRVGWGWGGSWRGTKDYMHFSANGR